MNTASLRKKNISTKEKCDQTYENHIKTLAELRLEHKNLKIIARRPRVIKRKKIDIDGLEKSCLVIINDVDDCVVLTDSSEQTLYWITKQRFG